MIDKRFAKILEKVDEILEKLDSLQGQSRNVTKEQLMKIPGVGSSLADKILEEINGS